MATWTVTSDVSRFEEAEDAFKKRVPMTADEAADLTDEERRRAFWVAGTHERAVVETIHAELDRAIAEGLPLEEFKQRLKDKLEAQHQLDGAHLETVFRNATQSAYNTGRWHQLTDPDVTAVRPYFCFDAVLDQRTTDTCTKLNGTIKAHDDPFWLTSWPPCHHRCRSGVRALRRSEAERRGGITEGTPEGKPQKGFGLAPPARGNDPRPPPTEPEAPPDGPKKPKKPKPPPDPRIQQVAAQREAEALTAADVEAAKDLAKLEERRRQDPSHWQRQYEGAYGPEAAELVSWGRAMEERGKALTIADAKETHRELRSLGLSPSDEEKDLFARLKDARVLKRAGTMGEVVEALEARDEVLLADEVRAMSALVGHARAIVPRAAPLAGEWKFVDVASKAEQAAVMREGDKALAILARLSDDSLGHPEGFELHYKPGQRGGYSSRDRRIRLGERPVTQMVVHEWAGHGIEDHNPEVLARALAFLDARTAGSPDVSLEALYPRSQYQPHEIVRLGGFFDYYVGRIYADRGATEIASMGLEQVSIGGATMLLQVDPEYYYFLLGTLAGRRAWQR